MSNSRAASSSFLLRAYDDPGAVTVNPSAACTRSVVLASGLAGRAPAGLRQNRYARQLPASVVFADEARVAAATSWTTAG